MIGLIKLHFNSEKLQIRVGNKLYDNGTESLTTWVENDLIEAFDLNVRPSDKTANKMRKIKIKIRKSKVELEMRLSFTIRARNKNDLEPK